MRTKDNPVQKILPAETAIIQEKQVTIQVLTIGTRQVTQSLYKQLVEDDVVDIKGELKGPVWGWVNLHNDCLDTKPHIHAVWEDNGQLKRTTTYLPYRRKWISDPRFIKDDFFRCSESYEYFTDLRWDKELLSGIYLKKIRELTRENIEYVPISRSMVQSRKEMIDNPAKFSFSKRGKKYDFLREYSSSVEELYEELKTICKQIELLTHNWVTSYQAIQDAGQLFVAVSGVWK